MLKIENTKVYGWEAAIRGMRNPKNSWDKSDSSYHCEKFHIEGCDLCDKSGYCELGDLSCTYTNLFVVGKNDLKLMKTLAQAGTDHGKFLRMINVTCDITAPVYVWAEIDTYKVGTVRNSCSFMHKGLSKPFELSDFSIEPDGERALSDIISTLNILRNACLERKDDKYFFMLRQMMPQGYMVRATWQANYQVLLNIYKARKNHRLPEWHTFCDWILSLPYFREICVED